jgi:uncharacterized membrane protein YdfJ with MMPL/SSD domain
MVPAFVLGNQIGTRTIDPAMAGPGESGRADRILATGLKEPVTETVLVQHPSLTTADPRFRAVIEDELAAVRGNRAVRDVASPLYADHADQVSRDGRTAQITFVIEGNRRDAGPKVGPIIRAVDAVRARHPGFFVGQIGAASADRAFSGAIGADLSKAGILSVPITLVILLLALGALVAAGIPLLIGLTSVVAAIGLLALPSHLMAVDHYVTAVMLLVGLAVGVDYAMFYFQREREERAAGRGPQAALEAAAATSGRSVLISGFSVMVAMAGMFFTGTPASPRSGWAPCWLSRWPWWAR